MTNVVLVGLGGSGGIAAHVLTQAGLEVVALEAGPRRSAAEMTLDEIRNDVRGWLSAPKAAGEAPTWRSSDAEEAGPSPWPVLMVNAVGGSTVHYPGLSIRLLPWHFQARTRTVERYGADAIPAGSTLADWPLSYDELAPFYDEVERAIGVSGGPGNVFEGPRAQGYPQRPLRRTGWTELTAAAARRLGWHPFPAPAAINAAPFDGRPACTYCGFCTGNGCYRDAKGSTDATVIPRAEATGLLRVVTGARVVRVEVDGEGLARGVTYVDGGRERFQPATAVLLGAFTYENVRLLLLSTSRAHPRGLGNGSGQVGEHFMAHLTPFAFGRFPGRKLGLLTGLWAQATCVEDWNGDNFDHAGLGFVGGAMLTAAHELKPIALASTPPPPGVPRWGAAWLAANAQSIGVLNAQVENLPYEGNRLDLDPVARDPYGVPVVRVTHRVGENERLAAAFMLERLREWLLEAGADEVWAAETPIVEGRHCYGGTRMGDDPASSVVDGYGFVHDAPNVGVLGASTFPTTGGQNPTLTVQALAWRTAQRLVDEWWRFDRGW